MHHVWYSKLTNVIYISFTKVKIVAPRASDLRPHICLKKIRLSVCTPIRLNHTISLESCPTDFKIFTLCAVPTSVNYIKVIITFIRLDF